jgi:hypothetical protein
LLVSASVFDQEKRGLPKQIWTEIIFIDNFTQKKIKNNKVYGYWQSRERQI